MPPPGDRSPGFFIEPSRCWAFVYDHNLQSTHCRENRSFTGRWHSPKRDGTWWRVWTGEAFRRTLRLFEDAVGSDRLLDQVKPRKLDAWVKDIRNRKLATRTIRLRIGTVKAFSSGPSSKGTPRKTPHAVCDHRSQSGKCPVASLTWT
jgi:hypothetical protein